MSRAIFFEGHILDCQLCTYELAILTTDIEEKNEYFEKNVKGGHKQPVGQMMGKFDREYWDVERFFEYGKVIINRLLDRGEEYLVIYHKNATTQYVAKGVSHRGVHTWK